MEKTESQKNVQAYKVQPKGKYVMVLSDLPPIKSATGEIYHVNRADEILRKGTVLGVGPDAKNCKKGDRILYFHDKCVEIECFYRSVYGRDKQCGKYILFDENVVAVIENVELSKYESAGATVKCLRAEDMEEDRMKAIQDAERRASVMPSSSKILRPRMG